MREIFQYKKGKDFYRDSLEYFEYDPVLFADDSDTETDDMDDDEISYYISQKLYKHKYE
jgi:hypothetical protein